MVISRLRNLLKKASDYDNFSLFAPPPGGLEKFLMFFMLD